MLRLFLGSALIFETGTAVSALNGIAVCLGVACAVAVIVGLTTPIAAVLTALIEATLGLNAHVGHLALHSFAPIVIGRTRSRLVRMAASRECHFQSNRAADPRSEA